MFTDGGITKRGSCIDLEIRKKNQPLNSSVKTNSLPHNPDFQRP